MNGVGCLRLTLQRARLMFGENIFASCSSVLIHSVSSSLLVLCCVGCSSRCCVLSFRCSLQHSSKGTRRVRCASMAACAVLTSWSWYLTKPVELGFSLYDRAWLHLLLASSAVVNVAELPFSFQSTLVRFGCEPRRTTLLLLLLTFSHTLKEHSRVFSALSKSFS